MPTEWSLNFIRTLLIEANEERYECDMSSYPGNRHISRFQVNHFIMWFMNGCSQCRTRIYCICQMSRKLTVNHFSETFYLKEWFNILEKLLFTFLLSEMRKIDTTVMSLSMQLPPAASQLSSGLA